MNMSLSMFISLILSSFLQIPVFKKILQHNQFLRQGIMLFMFFRRNAKKNFLCYRKEIQINLFSLLIKMPVCILLLTLTTHRNIQEKGEDIIIKNQASA